MNLYDPSDLEDAMSALKEELAEELFACLETEKFKGEITQEITD